MSHLLARYNKWWARLVLHAPETPHCILNTEHVIVPKLTSEYFTPTPHKKVRQGLFTNGVMQPKSDFS